MRNKMNIVPLVILLAFMGLFACETHEWVPPKWEGYDINENPVRPRPIVYDDHVAPLFVNNSCTAASCHDGAIPPDLTAANSESALSSYIDAVDPQNSLVVIQINDPEHGGTWNYLDLFTLLDWISQQ